MNINLMQFMQMIRSGQNPEQLVMNMLQQQMGNTPMGQNLMQLAQHGQIADIEQVVRNIAQQQGIDYDKEFATFKQTLGL